MLLTYRIMVPQYETEEQFSRLLTFLKQHRAAMDDVCFFTEYWHHGYYPLDQFSDLAVIIARRIETLRAEGFPRVGINLLDTLGHINEAWDYLPPWPYPPMIDQKGNASKCSPCPTNEEYLEYIGKKYTLIARAKPDFIWVDDDIRMQSHGTGDFYGCFCPECIRKSGVGDMDRETLLGCLNSPQGGEARRRWIENNIDVLDRLLHRIEEAVHRVDPQIDLGLMTGGLR